jgi:hypothetical protein
MHTKALRAGLFLLWLFTLPGEELMAQLWMQGEIRPRFEYRNGYRTLPSEEDPAAAFFSQRNRFGLLLKKDLYEFRLSLQNTLIWGSEPLKTNLPSFGLHEAWIRISLHGDLFLKAGRQELIYDNQRIFSNNDWINPGQRHDAAVFQFQRADIKLDFGVAFNQEKENLSGSHYAMGENYKFLGYVFFSARPIEEGLFSFLSLTDGFQGPLPEDRVFFRTTSGGSFRYDNPVYGFYVAGYLQFGRNNQGKSISAWYSHFYGELKSLSSFIFTAGTEVFSGNDYRQPGDPKVRYFDAPYGAGHRYNGNMDYFTRPSHTGGAGLINPYLLIVWNQNDRNRFQADLHLFKLQNIYLFEGRPIDQHLGLEADFSFRRSISRELSVHCGYSYMLAGKSLEVLKGGDSSKPAGWFFISIRANPTFQFQEDG